MCKTLDNPPDLLFKMSGETKVPREQKRDIIILIYKKGDWEQAVNYSLVVSLISVVCRILERIIRKQVVQGKGGHV